MSSIDLIIKNIVQKEIKPLKDEIVSLKSKKREREKESERILSEYKKQRLKMRRIKDTIRQLEIGNEKMSEELVVFKTNMEKMQNNIYFIENNTTDSVNLFEYLRKSLFSYPSDEDTAQFFDGINFPDAVSTGNIIPKSGGKKVTIDGSEYNIHKTIRGPLSRCFHGKENKESFVTMLIKDGKKFGRRVCSHSHNGFHCHWRIPSAKSEWKTGPTPIANSFKIIRIGLGPKRRLEGNGGGR